jgi:mannose-1-phosphate guanylyltransferase/mannose-6-phosphate isomerase
MGRNTAVAVAVAAILVLEKGDGLALVVPSDHSISTDRQFWETIEKGVPAAEAGQLVVFGVRPTHPETGYGYIEAGGEGDVRAVRRFVEKPDLATAETYLSAGTFFWNAGMFLFRASAMREAFLKLQPEIWRQAEAACRGAAREVSGIYLPQEVYSAVPSISVDYAIMEKTAGIAMVPAGFRWNDLGSWQSLLEVTPTDADGNVVVGDVVAIDTENSYLRSQGRLLSVIGMRDVAIVATPDATFVAPVSESQNVKKIVERLEKSGRLETKFTPAQDRVLANGAWLPRALAVRGSAAALVDRGDRRAPWRLLRSDGLRPPADPEAQADAHHGAADLRLLGGQDPRLGRPGGPADRTRRRLHRHQGPHRGRRLGPHARR